MSTALGLFDVLEDLFELLELGDDDGLAVALLRVEVEVVLVVVFGRVELGQGRDFRRDLAIKNFFVELLFILLGGFALLFAFVEDCRSVLRSLIVSLAIERRWVVGLPMDLKQLRIRNLFWIELDLDDLCMSGFAGTDLLIGRVLDVPAGVTRDNAFNSLHPLKHSFGAPEAAAAKRCFFQFLVLVLVGCSGGQRFG